MSKIEYRRSVWSAHIEGREYRFEQFCSDTQITEHNDLSER